MGVVCTNVSVEREKRLVLFKRTLVPGGANDSVRLPLRIHVNIVTPCRNVAFFQSFLGYQPVVLWREDGEDFSYK